MEYKALNTPLMEEMTLDKKRCQEQLILTYYIEWVFMYSEEGAPTVQQIASWVAKREQIEVEPSTVEQVLHKFNRPYRASII